jgi:hypothetical protein
MPATTENSAQYEALYGSSLSTVYPTEVHGVVRSMYVTHTQSAAGDATSSVALCKLPAGRVRLLLPECYFYVNWTTASATIDLGWDAYISLTDGSTVTADPNGLIDGLSVDTADVIGFEELTTLAGLATSAYTKLFESRFGVVIRATSEDTAIAQNDTISGVIKYMMA